MTPSVPHAAIRTRLSVMMFLQFFVWGAWYVSMPGWTGIAHLKGLDAWAYTVCPIAAIVSPFFLGVIADRLFATQRVLGCLHIIGGLALAAVPTVVSAAGRPAMGEDESFFHPFILMILAHALCYMPTLALTNSLSFSHMDNPAKQFPLVRVLGTIGWIAGNIVVGGSVKLGDSSVTWIPAGTQSPAQWYVAGVAGVLLGLYCFTLPHTPPPAAGRTVRISEILGLDSLKLLRDRFYLVFVVCSFLLCIPLAGYYSNAFNFVKHVSVPENVMITMSSGQMSEIVFMVLMPLLFVRLGVKWMLAAGMLAWVARYGLFAAASTDKVYWMTLIGVLLHGICYDFFFVTGFIYVDKKAPPEVRGQAQGFLVLITQGLGLGLGAFLFGQLVAHFRDPATGLTNWKMVWLVPSAFALLVLVLFVALFHDRTADPQAQD